MELMSANHRFIDSLVSQVSELRPVLDEHIRQNDELLPHVWMGDVTRFVVELYTDSAQKTGVAKASSFHILETILRAFEAEMESGDDEVKELIGVSFLENLDPEAQYYAPLKLLMGEELSKQLAKYESS